MIGDKCGQMIKSELVNDHLSIHLAFPELKTLCGRLEGNYFLGEFDGQSFKMDFNRVGNVKGWLSDSTEILIMKGGCISFKQPELKLETMGISNQFHDRFCNQYLR